MRCADPPSRRPRTPLSSFDIMENMYAYCMSSVMWDVVIIGAGISGASLANALCDGTSLRVMVIDRDDGAGGVWRQTKWSWLRSDTSAVLYSPTNSVGKSWVRAYGERGVPRDALVDLTTDYVKRVHAVFNCRVKKCEWYHGRWHIECDTDTYVAKWVVDYHRLPIERKAEA